jgi:hypothetical protein
MSCDTIRVCRGSAVERGSSLIQGSIKLVRRGDMRGCIQRVLARLFCVVDDEELPIPNYTHYYYCSVEGVVPMIPMMVQLVVILRVRGQNPGEASQHHHPPSLCARELWDVDTLGRNINFERSNRVEPGDRGLAATSDQRASDQAASCIE